MHHRLGLQVPAPLGPLSSFRPVESHGARRAGSQAAPGAQIRAATRGGFAGAPSDWRAPGRHPLQRRGLCQLRGGWLGGWDTVPQLDSVGGRTDPNSGLAAVCPEAQEQTGPPEIAPGTGASLPASFGGGQVRLPKQAVCAGPRCQGEPPAEAAGEGQAEPPPGTCPSPVPFPKRFPARLKWSERLSPSLG